MARLARVKAENCGAYYHLCGRTGGVIGDYPLNDKQCRRNVINFIKFFSKVFCMRVLGFSIMGNHYHLVIQMDGPRPIPRKELIERASLLYKKELLNNWAEANWKHFTQRILDVSEFMRSLQSKIARWYNDTYNRRGRFWSDRFKSVLLEDEKAMFDCLLYVELNPVRAGIVQRPEDYEGSSIYYREVKDDKWMAPISEITGQTKYSTAIKEYKACVYYRGNVPTKDNQAAISTRLLKQEEARGFTSAGMFKKRIRHFTDGVVIGSAEFVSEKLNKVRNAGQYLRRKNPIPQMDGIYLCLRPQRGA
ncbi:MAG: hypothetical protein JW841_09240 [Deltaproteobacteria bacterium]|nr:hypothetical protein [Deltaproteobacteria bacterium]